MQPDTKFLYLQRYPDIKRDMKNLLELDERIQDEELNEVERKKYDISKSCRTDCFDFEKNCQAAPD